MGEIEVDPSLMEAFAKRLKEDPKFRESMQKRVDLEDFKERFNVERSTPFSCPACGKKVGPSGFPIGGNLWIHKEDKNLFTCRKCELTFRINCISLPNDELLIQLKEAKQ